MSALNWFRVELDGNGKVVSCTIVAEPAENTITLHFVRARSDEAAGKAAFNAYYRIRQRAKRAQFRAEGRCTQCGRPRKDGCLQCQSCLDQVVASRERKKFGIPRPDLKETHARRREENADAIRLETLREVNRMFLARSKESFLRYLQTELEKLSKGRAA